MSDRFSVDPDTGYLCVPPTSADIQDLYDADIADVGVVMNATRLWAHQPQVLTGIFDLLTQVAQTAGLSDRQRGLLITASASSMGDAYCSLLWGGRLAAEVGAEASADVLRGEHGGLAPEEQVLATWARQVAGSPNSVQSRDVQALRDVGYDDQQILAVTAFVALRLAFATVNDALGARPDGSLVAAIPAPVRAAVDFGRPPSIPA